MSELIPYNDRQPVQGTPAGEWQGQFDPGMVAPPPDDTIDLRQLLRILRRRVWLIFSLSVVALLATAFVVLRQAPEYRATAVIRLSDERQAVAGGIGEMALGVGGRVTDNLQSQLQLLYSRTVAAAVVDRLGLRLLPVNGGAGYSVVQQVYVPDPLFRDTLRFEFGEDGFEVSSGQGEPVSSAYGELVEVSGVSLMVPRHPGFEGAGFVVRPHGGAVDWVISRLRANPRLNTNVADVEFTASDPVLAQNVVNAVVEEFKNASAREAQQQASRRRIFVEAQLAQTDSVLAEAQGALTDFQSREEVYSLEERFMAQQSGKFAIDIRREEMIADLEMMRRLLDRLRSGAGSADDLHSVISAPMLADNQVVNQIYSRLVEYEAERTKLTSGAWGLSASHPDVQRLNTLIEGTRTQLEETVASQIVALEARLAALDQLRDSYSTALKALPETGAEEARLRQQVATVHKMADLLREEYQRARIAEAVEAGQVTIMDAAMSPGRRISSRAGMKLTLGLLIGLMLGSGLAFMLEQMNTSIRGREELEEVLGLPGLAVIPRVTLVTPSEQIGIGTRIRRLLQSGTGTAQPDGGAGSGGNLLAAAKDQRFGSSEAYRMLRTNLLFSKAGQRLHTLVVTSAVPSEGKTTTSSNLAVTFAQQGMRVLLIGADLRKASIHKVFGLPREPGLTELLINAPNAEKAIHSTEVPGLYVIPSGALPPNPAELLGSQLMQDLLERLHDKFELIIIDTPPVLAASDAAVLARQADGTILVVRAGSTDRAASKQALHQLKMVGAQMLGAVLNDPDESIKGYGDGYYYYSYYGYGEAAGS